MHSSWLGLDGIRKRRPHHHRQECRPTVLYRWLLIIGLLLLGVALRAAYVAPIVDSPPNTEALQVSVAWAENGSLSDSYQRGQGPTAHLLPIPPILAGVVYRLFGVHTATAEWVLAAWASALVLVSFLALYGVSREVGVLSIPRTVALGILCLVPLNFHFEVVEFRVWEGALACALAFSFLLAVIRIDKHADPISWRIILAVSFSAALIFFVSPQLGVAAYVASLTLMVRKLPTRRWPGAILLALLALTAMIVPWTWRNNQALGEPVWLRSNLGLELAIAFHPGAGEGDPEKSYRARMEEIHPFHSLKVYQELQATGGEVAYSRALMGKTVSWIEQNPSDALTLAGKHAVGFLFPPEWYWRVWSDGGRAVLAKMALTWVFAAAGLLGMMLSLRRATFPHLYVFFFVLFPTLQSIVVQPTLRYRYLIYAILIFYASDLTYRLLLKRSPNARKRT